LPQAPWLLSLLLICLSSPGSVLAQQSDGAVFVTDKTGNAKDNGSYDNAGDVYVNGGRQDKNGPSLAPGTYYFQVTDSSGKILLSADNAECRQLTVAQNGKFAGAAGPASCRHANGTPSQQSTPVQLAPFLPVPNDGDQYTVWVIRQAGSTSVSQSDQKVINFDKANSKTDHFKVRPSPVVPVGSCQPSNAMSVLAADKQVFSFVPKGSWVAPQNDVDLVNVEPYAVALTRIHTEPVSSCSSDSRTGQTVCTSNVKDVYVFNPPDRLNPRLLQSSASGEGLFFGGNCTTCAVTMDAIHKKALLSMSLAVPPRTQSSAATSGFQFIDLGENPTTETAFRSEAPPAVNPGGEISKGVLIDPNRNWILSPDESGNFEIIQVSNQQNNSEDDDNKQKGRDKEKDKDHSDQDNENNASETQLAFFENNPINDPQNQFPASFASAGEDCRTGIALAPVEFSDPSEIYIADLTRAQFQPGPPGGPGSWRAPSNFQTLPGSSFPTGPNGIAVAQGTSIGLLAGMSSDSITAIKFPATSGAGTTPAITDWVTCRLPGITGNAPHTVNAYQSPITGHAMAVVENLTATALWRVDLTQTLNLPRAAHTCTSVFLPSNVVRTIVLP
jgi:hypothetical protein